VHGRQFAPAMPGFLSAGFGASRRSEASGIDRHGRHKQPERAGGGRRSLKLRDANLQKRSRIRENPLAIMGVPPILSAVRLRSAGDKREMGGSGFAFERSADPVDGVVAQLVERLVRNEKVRGSTPLGSTILQACASAGNAVQGWLPSG
jgi:hypothetical protein